MKQRITVTVDSDSYQLLKAYDVNISGLVSTTLQNEARRLRAERWQAENQEGMAEVARFIEMNGSVLGNINVRLRYTQPVCSHGTGSVFCRTVCTTSCCH